MNEKLEQSKNEIVKEYGYESFESFDDNSTFGYDHRTPQIMDKVAERYHELMDEWISVDERLPNKNILVNVCNIKDGWTCSGQINNDNLWYNQWQDKTSDADIIPTHWKPLPTPPKQ